jgi:predicted lipase
MYGFGSPRVGNIPFAEKFDELVFNAWRISNLNDIVTK